MILAKGKILERIESGDIFIQNTWSKACLKEASYALRVADDGLLIDGKFYDPGKKFDGDYISIEPGKIAILSTQERVTMPDNLVGKIGIRLEYAHQGLTGLMGIQVDPLYGRDKNGQPLYIRVANFGTETIRLSPGHEVFTFELHEVTGTVPSESKKSTWDRMKDELRYQSDASWSYVTQVENNLSTQTQSVKDFVQPLVMFGVFLVAATILGVVIGFTFQTQYPVADQGTTWGLTEGSTWLRVVLSVGIAGLAWVGFVSGWRFLRPYQASAPRRRKGWIRRKALVDILGDDLVAAASW